MLVALGHKKKQWHREQIKKALKNAFKDHCSIEENYAIISCSRLWMAFYTAKAVICLILHWNRASRARCGFALVGLRWLMSKTYDWDYGDDTISVAMWDYWEGGLFEPDNGWQELQVGYGVFQNWYCQIISNSSY